jgi:hypothetical protein
MALAAGVAALTAALSALVPLSYLRRQQILGSLADD